MINFVVYLMLSALESGHFYYGRYDLKCTSVADLKAGKNIQILEFNGTGAEPNHIYDCGMHYTKALKIIASHWRDMYLIRQDQLQKRNTLLELLVWQKIFEKSQPFFFHT